MLDVGNTNSLLEGMTAHPPCIDHQHRYSLAVYIFSSGDDVVLETGIETYILELFDDLVGTVCEVDQASGGLNRD